MDTSSRLLASTDTFFAELETKKEAIRDSWNHITATLDRALANRDSKALLELIPYIEQGEGAPAYEYIAETRRILRILHIFRLELAYHKDPLISQCTDKQSLMEKYMTALFALRRLFFRLSEDSVKEAESWLTGNPLSVFAVYVMTQEDLITPDNALYETIAEICFSYWNDDDKKLFLSLTAKEQCHE